MCQVRSTAQRSPLPPEHPAGTPASFAGTVNKEVTVKLRVYKLAFALASIAAFVEVLGAGRRF
jgi:hypothetical protein